MIIEGPAFETIANENVNSKNMDSQDYAQEDSHDKPKALAVWEMSLIFSRHVDIVELIWFDYSVV